MAPAWGSQQAQGFGPRLKRRGPPAQRRKRVVFTRDLPISGDSFCHNTASRGNSPPATLLTMLWTIAVILIVLWLLGFVGFNVIGAYIHILLVIAIIVILIQLIGGRRPL
jgi:hypothetical protein